MHAGVYSDYPQHLFVADSCRYIDWKKCDRLQKLLPNLYLLFDLVPAISGILNKIMFISESFTQIDGNVERMEEILHIPVLPDYRGGVKEQGKDIVFESCEFFL